MYLAVLNPDRIHRFPLNLMVSKTGTDDWKFLKTIDGMTPLVQKYVDAEPKWCRSYPEYSYPTVIVDSDDNLHIVYTHSRYGIKYVKLLKNIIENKLNEINIDFN